jgi:predicted ATPase/DNA-binding SARP family transcriptional activator
MPGERNTSARVTVRLLGPLEVDDGGRAIRLPPSRRRLLSILLLDPRRACSTDELIDRMWGDEPPATARTALHVNVSELRRVVPIITTPGGYRVDDRAIEIDRSLLERLVAVAETARASGEWQAALAAAEDAASLRRGEPFPDVRDEPYAAGAIARVDELFLAAADIEVDALMALGRNEAAILRLGDLIDRHPLHDRLRRHLMLAFFRAGRQGDALRAYQHYRKTLGDTMGIEPGEDLRDLEERILLHDPELGGSLPAPTPHNLPEPTTSFIGRDDEIRSVAKELGEARVVTITGGPGFGKTRLAIEIGRSVMSEYPGGVWFVGLAGASDARTAVATIAGTVSAGDRIDGLEELAALLRDRPLLLILDNCEHLVEPVSRFVHALSPTTAACRILVTSRRRLGVDGESVLGLRPLAPRLDESVALLADRIRAVDRTFSVTAETLDSLTQLCARLEGIPLALELLARWIPTLGLGDVARLLDRVHADTALGTAYEWSLALLPQIDGETLSALAAFESPFTFERAAEVCAGPSAELSMAGSISRLVDASLLGRDWSGRSVRYRMPQPIREMAWWRLEPGSRAEIADRHAASFVASAGPIATAFLDGRQAEAFATLDAEIFDYRQTMARLRSEERWSELLILIEALSRYWYARFLGWEGREWVGDVPVDSLVPSDRARLHRVAGFLAWAVHDYERADSHYSALHALGADLDDPMMRADGLYGRGLVHQKRRFLDGAAMLEEAARLYATIPGCELQLGECLLFRGLDEAYTGDVARGESLLREAAALLERTGHVRQVSKAHRWLAHCAWRREMEAEARLHAQQAEDMARSVADHIALGGALVEKAHIDISWGETDAAAKHLLEALDPIPEADEIDLAQVLFPVARLAVRMGEPGIAGAILSHIDDVYERHGWRPLDEIVGVSDVRHAVQSVGAVGADLDQTVRELLTEAIRWPASHKPGDAIHHRAAD